MAKKTPSGLGIVTKFKVKELLRVYRTDTLYSPNAVALAGILATQTRSGNVRSAIVYNDLPGVVADMPPIYLFGATERQQNLFDKIIESGRNDPVFLANLQKAAAANPEGIYIVVSNSSSLPTEAGGLVGGMAQPGPVGGGQFAVSDGQFELQAGDIGRSDALAHYDKIIKESLRNKRKAARGTWTPALDAQLAQLIADRDAIEQEANVYFARHVIHEMFHWDATHNYFRVPGTAGDLGTLLDNWSNADILAIATVDPTYGPSDKVLQALQVELGLDPAVLANILSAEQAAYGQNQLNAFKNRLYRFYLKAGNDPNITIPPERIPELVARGVLELKAGSTAGSADINDYKATQDVIDEEANRLTRKAAAEAKRLLAIGELNAELKRRKVTDIEPFQTEGAPADEERLRRLELALERMRRDLEAIKELDNYGNLGSSIGKTLANFVGGDKTLNTLVVSPILATIGDNLFEVIANGGVTQTLPSGAVRNVLADFDSELFGEIKSAGIGALSSFLVAELVNGLGIDGVFGEGLQTIGNTVVSQIFDNIVSIAGGADIGLFANVGNGTALASAGASFIGGKLADQIVTFDTVGGQIGSAVGSAFGAWNAASYLAVAGINPVTLVAAVIAVAFWKIVGGLIGSIFGGTPRSGADVTWDQASGRFAVANIYSKKGGSKEAARSMATSVSGYLNSILDSTGGILENPGSVQTGNYGMRKKDIVYRPYSTRSKHAITQRWRGEDASQNAVRFGTFIALTDPDFDLLGGSIFAKRALTNHLSLVSSYNDFSMEGLAADLLIASDYANYFDNSREINLLLSGTQSNAFSAGWAVTLTRAEELGLHKRATSDWNGGFSYLFDEQLGMPVSLVELNLVEGSGFGRNYIVSDAEGDYQGFLTDTINAADQTHIEGTASNDVITLTHQSNHATTGGNKLNLTEWPGFDEENQPVDGVAIEGWTSSYIGETEWSTTTGPNGVTVRTLHGGQENGGGAGGGAYSDTFEIDGSKTYQFTYYFKNDAAAVHSIYFGVSGSGMVKNASNGAVNNNPYFYAASASTQNGGLEAEKWYKVVGYVLPTGSANQSNSVMGGVYDAETGEKVANTSTFRWNESRPSNQAVTRFFNHYGSANVYNTHFYKPEVRELIQTAVTGGADHVTSNRALRVDGFDHDGSPISVDVSATIDAGAGNDTVHAGDLGNNVFGGDGNDTIYGGRLDDWLFGGAGTDTIYAGAQNGALGGDGNFLDGGDGNDVLYGREGSDWLEGGDGVDTINGHGGGDILSGGAGAGDQLHGGAGDDQYILRRGDGADIADDTDSQTLTMDTDIDASILGQFSSQYLALINQSYANAASVGAAGYVDARWTGLANGTVSRDWFGYLTPGIRNGAVDGGEDSIVLGTGIGLGDVRLKRSTGAGDDLIIEIMETDPDTGIETFSGDQLTVKDWFSNIFKRVEWLKFADGNEIRIADITSFVAGTNGNDILIGTEGNDFVYGGGGNDQLFLLAGDDVGSGGSGRDLVAGDSGNDLIVGGSQNDVLMGGAGADVLSGDAGSDDVYGGAGADIISGGRGDDQLVGGEGDDVFKYSRGDGADTVFDEFVNGWDTVWSRTSGNGTWRNGYSQNANGEVTASDGTVVRKNYGSVENPDFRWVGRWDYDSETQTLKRYVEPNSGSFVIDSDGPGTTTSIPFPPYFYHVPAIGDTIEFGLDINIQDLVLARSGDDLILNIGEEESGRSFGSSDSITLKHWYLAPNNIERLAFYSTGILNLASTNIVAGTALDDLALNGLSTADWITGAEGDDIITGNAGDDILSGNIGVDIISGGAGVDVLYGGSGNDFLNGGLGGDFISGGSGSDWASYENASSAITVALSDPSRNTGEAAGDIFSAIENVLGSNHADKIIGDGVENILEGGKGNDVLEGGEGDDTYVWNATSSTNHDGADIINEGGDGSETAVNSAGVLQPGFVRSWEFSSLEWLGGEPFVFSKMIVMQGTEIVYRHPTEQPEFTSYPAFLSSGWLAGFTQQANGSVERAGLDVSVDAGQDTIELGKNIHFADLSFINSGNDLILRYGNSSASQLTIKSQSTVGGQVESLQFHDGLVASLTNLKINTHGGIEDDLIIGTSSAQTRNGGDGDDVIFGGGGNDILRGQNGDDIVEGGSGADNLQGGANSTNVDNPSGWGDTVRYASSKGANVEVDFRKQATGAIQVGGDAQGDVLSGFENYVGSDFVRDNFYGDDNDNRIFGLGGSDILRGLGGDDVISGGEGNDYLYGYNGIDNLSGGDGVDYLNGGNDDDVLDGGDGQDRLYGANGDDKLFGGEGDDGWTSGANIYGLYGGNGDDTIDGGAGDDIIFGEANNDILSGGTGDDTIDGGSGDDIFVLGANDGLDTITDTSGINSVVFTEALTRDRVWLTKEGNDLRLSIIGGETSALFKNFYAGGGALERIVTADGTLYLNDLGVREMIRQMTGGYAATRSLLDLSGWPTAAETPPTNGAAIAGWTSNYIGETEWSVTSGPEGYDIASLHGGQEDGGGAGGGAYSETFEIDGSKGYEFTYYFKNDGDAVHNIYFGLNGNIVKNASNGAANGNPYFYAANPATQNANLESDRWYKVVGYVLPEGSPNQSDSALGGIFDAETGEKVQDTVTFKWNEARPNDMALSRFFNHYGTQNTYNTHFYRPDVRELGSSNAPPALPAWFASKLDRYWETGETAAPRAPENVQIVDVTNYSGNAINTDGWPDVSDTGRGENLVLDNGWPGDVDAPPAGDANIADWINGYAGEADWVSTTGPYNQQVVSMNTGQLDSGNAGGGSRTNDFDIDKSKAYEFTYYFKADELNKHRIYLGLAGTDVKNGHNGAVNGNPYFTYDYPTAASGIESGKWYKAVGYVLPEGSENRAHGTLGGIYDTETGEKVRNITSFRWNENQADTSVHSRFFNYYDTANQGQFTHFYKPEVREIENAAILTDDTPLDISIDAYFVKAPDVEGWRSVGWASRDGEARWIETDGPNGGKITALEAGQFDASANGGGNYTHDVSIDPSKTYKYTQYVRKSDLTKHYLYSGVVATGAGGTHAKELLTNGSDAYASYFLGHSMASQQAAMDEDKWYKLVGYILPAGSSTAAHGSYGGVFDAETGDKVLSVHAFRWTSGVSDIKAYGRFFTYHDTANHGWSTQFGAPELSIVDNASLAQDNADPLGFEANQRNIGTLIDASIGVQDRDNNIASYEIDPNGSPAKGSIEIVNASTGQIRYTPDVGATGSDSFTLLVRDADENLTPVTVELNISVPGINRAPDVPVTGFVLEIDENSAANSIAGTLTTTDPDGDTLIDYRFAGSLVTMVGGKYVTHSADGKFKMERDTGVVRANAAVGDRETGSIAYNYEMIVSDKNSGNDSRSAETTLTINVGDVNELHQLNTTSFVVNHYNKALGPFVPMPDEDGKAINLREAMLVDPENANMKWSIVGSAGPWSIDQDGLLHLVGAISSGSSYSLTVRATDSLNRSADATLSLSVNGIDGSTVNPVGGSGGTYGYDDDPDDYYYGGGYDGYYFENEILAPIVLDLDGDGLELISFANSNTEFDMDGDGNRDRTGWVGADDGLLVLDINRNGLIDDGSEISFQRFVDGAFSDLEGLAFFDTNGNGLLDSGDANFADFQIWQDSNSDGVSQAGELSSLSDLGIASLSLTGALTGQSPNASDNAIYATADVNNADGTTGTLGDTFFVFDPLTNTPGVEPPVDDPAPDVPVTDGGDSTDDVATVSSQSFDRKSKKFRLAAMNGLLFISPKKVRSVMDPRSGRLIPDMRLDFTNRQIGLLSAIILDLDGDGLETRNGTKTDAWFDMDGNGSRDDTGWASGGDGYLVVDSNDDGIINDGAELSFMSEVAGARNGLQALASFDSNRDGRINAADARFGELKIWVDRNENGVTDAGELGTLEEHGIESFSLTGNANSQRVKVGKNIVLATSIFTRTNGTTGTLADTVLSFTPGADMTPPQASDSVLPDMFDDFGRFLPPELIPELGSELTGAQLEQIVALTAGLGDNGTSLTATTSVDAPDNMTVFDYFEQPSTADETGGQQITAAQDEVLPAPILQAANDTGPSASSQSGDQSDPVKKVDMLTAEYQGGPQQVDPDIAKLALITQDMSVFGATSAAISEKERKAAIAPVDYFAA